MASRPLERPAVPMPVQSAAIRLARSRYRPGRAELRALARLALPVATVQVGMMLMGVVDTIMVGHVSAAALAAVALGNLYFWAFGAFCMGVLMALDPVVAQAVGARDEPAIGRALQRGLLLAAALSVLFSLTLLPAGPVLTALRQPADVVPTAAGYALASVPGTFPLLVFLVLRQTLQAMGRTTAIVAAIVVANAANVVLNWMLIYGKLGAPALGAVGSAWASSLSRGVMALALLAAAWRALRPHLAPRREALALRPLGRMLRLGAPIGAQSVFEFSAFAVIALFMGWLGTETMAGHQVALNLAALTYMVPLGVATAGAVLVGQAVGRGDAVGARRSAGAAIVCGVAFMTLSAAVFLSAPEALARLYTDDAVVLAMAATLIPLAGLFQVFDGLQVVAAGVLRGVGDTRAPMVVNLIGYWLVGMPVSLYLGFRTAAGPAGLWWGLVAGLAAVALFLLARVRVRLGRELRRLTIDDEAAGLAEERAVVA